MPTFNSFSNHNNDSSNQVSYDFSDKQSKGLFLTKVFGMMFICLLITTAVAAGLGFAFQSLLLTTNELGELIVDENVFTALVVALIGSAIGLLIMSFVLPIVFARGKHNILVPLLVYVVLMGVLLSSFVIFFDWVILAEAFGVTTIIFGVMGLLGYVSKGKLTGIGFILLALLIGAIGLSLFNWLMILVHGISESNVMLSWIVSLMVFAFLMFITLYDVYRIKKIAEDGSQQDNNLIYYCAYILYSDFIAILMRVVYYLALFTGRRK